MAAHHVQHTQAPQFSGWIAACAAGIFFLPCPPRFRQDCPVRRSRQGRALNRISRRLMLAYGLAAMAGIAGGICPASALGDTDIMHGAKTGGRSRPLWHFNHFIPENDMAQTLEQFSFSTEKEGKLLQLCFSLLFFITCRKIVSGKKVCWIYWTRTRQ
jgi:hypothetical protein